MSAGKERREIGEKMKRMKVAARPGEHEELERLRWIDWPFGHRTLMGAFVACRLASRRQPHEYADDKPPWDQAGSPHVRVVPGMVTTSSARPLG
jgi:hypothetical protein